MARRKQTDTKERRTATVTVQFTPTERAKLGARAEKVGVSMSDYARAALLGYRLHVKNPMTERALDQLFGIGTNLNQIAKHANTTGEIREDAKEGIQKCHEVLNMILDNALAGVEGETEEEIEEGWKAAAALDLEVELEAEKKSRL